MSASSASASLRWVDGRVAALRGAEAEIEILKILLTLRNIMDYYCRIWEWAAENLSERNLKCWKYRTYKLCVTLQLRGPKILKRCIEKVIENFDHETLQTLQTLLLDVSEGSRAKCSKERARFTDSPEWIWMDLVQSQLERRERLDESLDESLYRDGTWTSDGPCQAPAPLAKKSFKGGVESSGIATNRLNRIESKV